MPALARLRAVTRRVLRVAALRRFAADTRGATTAEYGLLTAVVAAIAVAALTQLSGPLGTLYDDASTNVASASAGAGDAGGSGSGSGGGGGR